MSLLGNQNSDFEKKLKKQLGDTEFKPAESLWSRIDREVNRPEFEEKVEGKVGNYTLKPYPETWEQIEAQLPPEPSGFRRRRMYWFSGLVVLLFVMGFGIGYLINGNSDESLVSNGTVHAPQKESVPTYTGKNRSPEIEDEVTHSADVNTVVSNKQDKLFKKTEARFASTKHQSKEGQSEQIQPLVNYSSHNKANHVIEIEGKSIPSNSASRIVSSSLVSVDESTPSVAPNNAQSPALAKQANPEANLKEAKQASVSNAETSSGSNEVKTTTLNETASQSPVSGSKEDKQVNTVSGEPNEDKSSSVKNESVNHPADSGKKELLTQSSNKLAPLSDSVNSLQTSSDEGLRKGQMGNLSISVIAGAHYSLMRLTSTSAKFNEVLKLRRQIESPKIDWSGGFLLDYHINEHWMVSSGIMFTHFSMNMSYGTAQAKQNPVYEQGGRYSTTDSVTADGVNNTRIKYSWNEIPLLVTYRFNPTRRFGIEAKVGVSYAMLNVVDAAMVGQNNVGLFVLKNQEAFPVLNNSWFMQAFLGATYKLNESVTLTLMPYGKVSLNGMVEKQDWIQQKPYMLGLSAGLRKRF